MTDPRTSRKSLLSGLDMSSTIDWYALDYHAIMRNLCSRYVEIKGGAIISTEPNPLSERTPLTLEAWGSSFPYSMVNMAGITLTESDMHRFSFIFPEKARARSILKRIVGQPQTWFHKDSEPSNPKPTTTADEALSPTAIIPSYISYNRWQETGDPQADIWLYKLDTTIPERVRTIITIEGFVHEYAHSIIAPALYCEGYNLRLSPERIIQGEALLSFFAEAAEQHPPISHYSSEYWEDGRLRKNPDGSVSKTALNEELAETITAHLLGFVFCDDEKRRLDPLGDRPRVKELVDVFLNAELINPK